MPHVCARTGARARGKGMDSVYSAYSSYSIYSIYSSYSSYKKTNKPNHIIMKDITICVRFELYLADWLGQHFGSPVRFPNHSPENVLLHRLLSVLPRGLNADAEEDNATGELVKIVLTDSSRRKPEHYNYLGRRGRAMLRTALTDLFILHLWTECASLLYTRRGLNAALEEWCRNNGIRPGAREAVRQKFYRLRRIYARNGVIVTKFYGKKLR